MQSVIQIITNLFKKKKGLTPIAFALKWFIAEFGSFLNFLRIYAKHKLVFFSYNFENSKNIFVRLILLKRGRVNRIFLHVAAMTVVSIGAILSPFISDAHPFFQQKSAATIAQNAQAAADPLSSGDVFETKTNADQRDSVISYTVQKGDTISTIAHKFNISEDTIKWENDLKGDDITVGDELKILPVTGIAHKVARGETVQTIASKYQANAQAIVDFPFNQFANPQTFSLIEGQIIIVPDGVKPADKPRYQQQPTYIATGPVVISGAGFTWPTQGSISQFFAWYHPGIDIAAPIGTPIVAAHDGVVSQVFTGGWNGGYGVHVIVTGDNGYSTLYAHMQPGITDQVGQRVVAGKTLIGTIGLTGRTTGPHLHFEVRSSGGNVNPMSFLR